jgi:ABC-type amino acid transport substrate-binding protein
VVTLLGSCAASGILRVQWRRAGAVTATTVAICVALVFAGRFYMNATATQEYNKDKVVAAMHLPRQTADGSVVAPAPNPVALKTGQSRLDRIRERGVIRIGFDTDNLPFSYINQAGDPTGFDLELMSKLAMDLDVSVELVPLGDRAKVHEELRLDYYDLAVGGFIDTVFLSQRTPFSNPYMHMNMALVIPDFRDRDFASMEAIGALDKLRIAVVESGGMMRETAKRFAQAEIVSISSPREFFKQTEKKPVADALLISAEAGSAWTMLFPQYQVSTPLPHPVQLPVVILYSGTADPAMDEFLDNWVMLKQSEGALKIIYDYWILGIGAEPVQPRWSVIRNVLHWID